MQPFISDVWNPGSTSGILPPMPAVEPSSTMEVASRLKMTREALGLSQAELCRLTKIETNTWNNAEKGRARIGLESALLLCRATGVSLDWIYRDNRDNLPRKIALWVAAAEKAPIKRRANG